MGSDIRMAYLEMRRAGKDRFPPQCWEYIYRFVFQASLNGKDFQHLSARELCPAFSAQVRADFGALTGHVLERWDLASFGDLGQAIFLLAEYNCFKLNATDTLEEYIAAGPIHFV